MLKYGGVRTAFLCYENYDMRVLIFIAVFLLGSLHETAVDAEPSSPKSDYSCAAILSLTLFAGVGGTVVPGFLVYGGLQYLKDVRIDRENGVALNTAIAREASAVPPDSFMVVRDPSLVRFDESTWPNSFVMYYDKVPTTSDKPLHIVHFFTDALVSSQGSLFAPHSSEDFQFPNGSEGARYLGSVLVEWAPSYLSRERLTLARGFEPMELTRVEFLGSPAPAELASESETPVLLSQQYLPAPRRFTAIQVDVSDEGGKMTLLDVIGDIVFNPAP